jgi:secondary thiamine-phosphate synthase enzyme
LTINENSDPDVRSDLEKALNILAPENGPWDHVDEGSDDMPAHIKSSLLSTSLVIPVADGRLGLGTWQGVYFCEHRNSENSTDYNSGEKLGSFNFKPLIL